jgi:hypothetical protein
MTSAFRIVPLAAWAACALCTVATAGEETLNPANNWLLHQSPKRQAAMLGKAVGEGCVGRTPFYQGTMEKDAKPPRDRRPEAPVLPGTENDAFWSIKCGDGRSYSVEVHPDGSGKVLECSVLKLFGENCFRKYPGQ